MIKSATSAIVLSCIATSAFTEGYTAPTVGVEPVNVTEGVAALNSGLIVPASVLLTVVAAIASDGVNQAPEDVAKSHKKRSLKKKKEVAAVAKGEVRTDVTPSSPNLPLSTAGGSAKESTRPMEVAVRTPIGTESEPANTSTSPTGNAPASTTEGFEKEKTVFEKIVEMAAESSVANTSTTGTN